MVTSKSFATFSRASLFGLGSLIVACGGQRMSLGSNDEGNPAAAPRHCDGGSPSGALTPTSQGQIDALLGCEVLDGSLRISPLADAEPLDLSPLASLRIVTGNVELYGIPSLAGLQALEQVGNLALEYLDIHDLSALSNLQRVVLDPPGGGDGGLISITGCPTLQSLAGLEQLNTWSSLSIDDAPALATLLGLAGPAKLRQLQLSTLPVLHDLHGLEFAREVDYVLVEATGIVSLQGMPLTRTQSLQLRSNSELTDLKGLNRLSAADELAILDNDSLNSVELGALSQVESIKITGNDALTKIYAYGADEGTAVTVRDGSDSDLEVVRLSRLLFEVGDNAKLGEIAGPDGFTQVQEVSIWGNPALTKLNLNHLERAEGLEILDNTALKTLIVPQLERVGDLKVVNNPKLSTSTLNDVQTFTRTLSGNDSAATPPAAPTPPVP